MPPTCIYKYIRGSHSDVFDNLKKAGLLTKDALGKKKCFIKRIKHIEDDYLAHISSGPMPTPVSATSTVANSRSGANRVVTAIHPIVPSHASRAFDTRLSIHR